MNAENLGSPVPSENTSISSMRVTSTRQGRTYETFYEDVPYYLHSDQLERERLTRQHETFCLEFNKELCFTPLRKDIKDALDLGAGSGNWAMSFAEAYPNTSVEGVDISLMQPKWVPKNCQFVIDDVEAEWSYSKHFDFIFGRNIEPGIEDWRALSQQAATFLVPGGCIEFQGFYYPFDYNRNAKDTPLCVVWSHKYLEACQKLGKNLQAPSNWGTTLEEAGFENVVTKRFDWQVAGPLSDVEVVRKRQEAVREHMLEEVLASRYALQEGLSLKEEDINDLCQAVAKEIEEGRDIPVSRRVYVCYGRKSDRSTQDLSSK